jgi:hypothetical protein
MMLNSELGSTTTTGSLYDKLHRLYRSTKSGSATADMYDAVGTRVKEVTSSTTLTYTYDADNELTTTSYSPTNFWISYSYNGNGNRVAYQTSLGDTETYAYDYENRLISLGGSCIYTFLPNGEQASDSCRTGAPYQVYDPTTGSPNLVASTPRAVPAGIGTSIPVPSTVGSR